MLHPFCISSSILGNSDAEIPIISNLELLKLVIVYIRTTQEVYENIVKKTDKLDMTGAIGIARVLLYQGFMEQSIYRKDEDSFLNEYQERLLKVYDSFYTEEARKLANKRKDLTYLFYQEIIGDKLLNDYENILLYIHD